MAFPLSFSPQGLQLTVPEGARSGLVTVINAYGTGTSTMSFTVHPRPVIYEITPAQARPGQEIYVTGGNFIVDGLEVTIGGRQVPVLNREVVNTGSIPPTERLIVRVPTIAAAEVAVNVATLGGTSVQSGRLLVLGAPQITRMVPNPIARGAQLLIFGSDLSTSVPNGTVRVAFASTAGGGRTEVIPNVLSETLLSVTVPIDAVSGNLHVILPSQTTTSANSLEIDEELPSIIRLDNSVVGVGDEARISGYNLDGAQAIRFANQTSTITFSNAAIVRATVPTTTIAGNIEIDVNIAGRGLVTAVSPAPFSLLLTNDVPGLGVFTRIDGLSMNGSGNEFITVSQPAGRLFQLARYDSASLNELVRTDLPYLGTLSLPISSFDISPSGEIGIITRTTFDPAGYRETVFVFRVNNPSEYSTCTGVRARLNRQKHKAFAFDASSQFAYSKWPLDQGSGSEGVLKIDIRNPGMVVCTAIGLLPASSGFGGFQGVLITDRQDGLVVLDQTLGLAVLDIVETSTSYGNYSSWQGPGEIATDMVWDQDPQYVWLIGGLQNVRRRSLYRSEPAQEIQGSILANQSTNAQSADRKWLFGVDSQGLDLTVIDLNEQRVMGSAFGLRYRSSSVMVAHPSRTRFFTTQTTQQIKDGKNKQIMPRCNSQMKHIISNN